MRRPTALIIAGISITWALAACGETPKVPDPPAPKTTASPQSTKSTGGPGGVALKVCEVLTADEVAKVFGGTVTAQPNDKSLNKGCDYMAGNNVVLKTHLLSMPTSMFGSPEQLISGTAAGMKQDPVSSLGVAAAYLIDDTLSDKLIIVTKSGDKYIQFQLWTLDDKQQGNRDKLMSLGRAATQRI